MCTNKFKILKVITITLLNIFILTSCATYKQRVDRVCKRHGLKELPTPLVTVDFYYGRQKVKDLFELKMKIDSADVASGYRKPLDTIAVDINGRVVHEGSKDRSVRPMMRMRVELPKDALFEDLQKIRGYKGIRIVPHTGAFQLYESNGHKIDYSSSFWSGGGGKSYSRIAVMDYTGFIDDVFFFPKPFYEDDYYSFEVLITYLKGDNGKAYGEKGANLSLLKLGECKFVFQEGVVRPR